MKQHRNAGAEETGDPRENPTTSDIVRHYPQLRTRNLLGIEPGSPRSLSIDIGIIVRNTAKTILKNSARCPQWNQPSPGVSLEKEPQLIAMTLKTKSDSPDDGCQVHRNSPVRQRPVNLLASNQGDPGFCMWESYRTMPLVGGFSRGSPVSPALPLRRRSILTSITLFGSQDLAVKSRPNLSSQNNWWRGYLATPLEAVNPQHRYTCGSGVMGVAPGVDEIESAVLLLFCGVDDRPGAGDRRLRRREMFLTAPTTQDGFDSEGGGGRWELHLLTAR
ncbi:hypothetical protein PR048_032509 [Dryococelus australis]|uniref:Uncharacterized protein n=1 Tax=Dryococelus australis TaxID=614101 RepID=A0ABQ9G2D5_9NEOP|nr:hypothetical protein PR048_032509 [Dryococelus australis]